MGLPSGQALVPLPQVSFRKIENPLPLHAGVNDAQARSFGFNDVDDEFVRPEHYIRYIEPIESELATQVEYDMDEQDQEWLNAMNAERKKEQLDIVSYETFEIIMDRLEKEWFDLMKRVPKQDTALPSEDSTCAICDDGEGENSNAIVFCDGCNLAVHQDCYGVPYIPEGQWLCRKCTVAPEMAVSCLLCPNEGGAFKQTTEAKWSHLLCAMFVPECTLGNQVFMEPIEGISRIPKQRWRLSCSLCNYRMGASIQCDKSSCFTAFHVTCARKQGLLTPMKSLPDSEGYTLAAAPPLRAFCEKHLTPDMRAARETKLAGTQDDAYVSPASKISKSARAYAKTYRLGPPLVPAVVVTRLTDYISRIVLRKKSFFLLSVCKYWSLKREARRGAPLLKRLHLEPWTASSISKQQTDETKQRRLTFLHSLRGDLEKVRMLADLTRKREREKTRSANVVSAYLDSTLFSYDNALQAALEQISAMDRHHYFATPVSAETTPDYYKIIQRPMHWEKIKQKLDSRDYSNVQNFKDDIYLVLDNSMKYNAKPDHLYHRIAARIKGNISPIFEKLFAVSTRHHSLPPDVGDLEASLSVLQMLRSNTAVEENTGMVIDAPDPLASLFMQDVLKNRSPPTPPPKKFRGRPPKVGHRTNVPEPLSAGGVPQSAHSRNTRSRVPTMPAEIVNPSTRTIAPLPRRGPGRPPKIKISSTTAAAQAYSASAPHSSLGSLTPPGTLEYIGEDGLTPQQRARDKHLAERRAKDRVRREEARERDRIKREREMASRALYRDRRRAAKERERQGFPPILPGEGVFTVTNSDLEVPDHNDAGSSSSVFPVRLTVLQREAAALQDSLTAQGTVDLLGTRSEQRERVAHESQRDNLVLARSTVVQPNDAPRYDDERYQPLLEPLTEQIVQGSFGILPQLVDEVDNKQSFQMFNEGWVLPEGSSRRPRSSIDGDSRATSNKKPNAMTRKRDRDQTGDARRRAPREARRAASFHGRQDGPSVIQTPDAVDVFGGSDSDLTDVSIEAGGHGEEPLLPTMDIDVVKVPIPADDKERPLVIGEHLPGGTLVWAKIQSFPWWPAVVYETDDPMVSEAVRGEYKARVEDELKRGTERRIYLAQFYDNRRSWGIVLPSEIALLAEDREYDDVMLKGTSKNRFRNKETKRDCYRAYRQAIGELDNEPTEGDGGSEVAQVE